MITLDTLRSAGAGFALNCYIDGDKIDPGEISKMTTDELKIFIARIENTHLLKVAKKELKNRTDEKQS